MLPRAHLLGPRIVNRLQYPNRSRCASIKRPTRSEARIINGVVNVSEPHQQPHLYDRYKASRRRQLGEPAHTEFEAECEHQQDHAELGKYVDATDVGEQRKWQMRSNQNPGNEIADYYWLP
jgi:hypothetical protein